MDDRKRQQYLKDVLDCRHTPTCQSYVEHQNTLKFKPQCIEDNHVGNTLRCECGAFQAIKKGED